MLVGTEPEHCGVDEAGRGPIAGPVYAAAVILDPARPIAGLRDSKQLSKDRRERLADAIRLRSLAFSVASASVEEIDSLNILQATMLAMRRAIEGLSIQPLEAWIDGNRVPKIGLTCKAYVRGDQLYPAISAASILAKTARDAEMRRLHDEFPLFGFDRHKGYPTREHLEAIQRLGVCRVYRRSFAPVKRVLAGEIANPARGQGL